MNLITLAVLVLHLSMAIISPQQIDACGSKAGALLLKDKPTIYITFDRISKSKPVPIHLAAVDDSLERVSNRSDESIEVVWLRLHNNTNWAINFPTDSLYLGSKIIPIRLCDGRGALGLRTDIEVNARYEVEAIRYDPARIYSYGKGSTMNSSVAAAKPPVISRSDMFSSSWLPSGGSVMLRVPREHLAERLAIYIPYNYEWEYGERIFRSDEPQHRVYFRASDLPEKVPTKNSSGLQSSTHKNR